MTFEGAQLQGAEKIREKFLVSFEIIEFSI